MAASQYRAINTSGETVEGILSARDRSEVIVLLREKDLKPIDVSEQKAASGAMNLSFGSKKVKIKDVAVFCRQFHTMLNSGISIIQCLDILRQQFDNMQMRKVISDIYEQVQKGTGLSESMREHRDVFPELLINMVEAGEISGNLDTILSRMADHFENDTRLKRKIKSAMSYPIVLSVVMVVVTAVLLIFVMPTFTKMFTDSGTALPGPTQMLLNVSNFLVGYWYIVIGVIVVGVIVFKKWRGSESGALQYDKIKLKMPVVGPVSVRVGTVRFTRTLSTLLASGIPLLNAMEITARVVGNKLIEQAILSVREDVRKGCDLAGPIKRTGIFPPMVDNMIRIGEESGSLDDVLKRTADFYDEEAEAAIAKMTGMLEPIMICVMAVVIGGIVIAMYMPMFSMMDTIGA